MLQLDILHHQVKSSVPRMGYILLSQWSKGLHRSHQTSQATDKAITYSSQQQFKYLLLKIPCSFVKRHGEIEILPSKKLHLN